MALFVETSYPRTLYASCDDFNASEGTRTPRSRPKDYATPPRSTTSQSSTCHHHLTTTNNASLSTSYDDLATRTYSDALSHEQKGTSQDSPSADETDDEVDCEGFGADDCNEQYYDDGSHTSECYEVMRSRGMFGRSGFDDTDLQCGAGDGRRGKEGLPGSSSSSSTCTCAGGVYRRCVLLQRRSVLLELVCQSGVLTFAFFCLCTCS